MENESLDSVNEYFKHLSQITREINREEISALWKQVKKGDKEAKNRMMELNLRLVIPTAKRFQRPGMELMDLIEEGNLGLMQAIEKFDPSKGYRFSTYAVYWIEQYIRKYIEEQSGSIKIPSHAWGNLKKWFKAWNSLREENGRDPSLAQMAAELDLSARQVKAVMDTLSAATGVESLASLVGGEDEMTLEDVLSDDGKGNPHDVFLRSENTGVLQKSLMQLNDRDREILTLRFGLLDNEPKTLGEVAEKMGLSRERVRQLEERAVSQMRKAARKAGLLESGSPADFRTRKLHAGLAVKPKTNILGEVADRGPLLRLLRRAAQSRNAALQKKAAKSSGLRAGKAASSKSAGGPAGKSAPAASSGKVKSAVKRGKSKKK